MRNHPVSSVLVASVIAAAIAGLIGLVVVNNVASSVTPQDPNLTVDLWRAAYLRSIGWTALAAAVCSALWLLLAHAGRGLDTKSGQWYTLCCLAILIAAILAWLIPPSVREGPLKPMLVNGGLALLGYWIATFFTAPDHYRFTPPLARAVWGKNYR
jgi:hypothetical protein